MARSLTDRVMVVTGASSGIGRATAIEAARAGMDVVVSARRADRLASVAEAIRALGRKAAVVVGDVADRNYPAELLDAAERTFGGADAVFSNAGYGAELPFLGMSDAEIRRMFEVNFFASIALCRAATERWRRAGRPGHLLLCSSCLARFTLPGMGPYAASKAAQAMVARSLRYELRADRIEVSSVHPITTATEFFEVAGGSGIPDHAPKFLVQRPERVAKAVIACLRRPKPEVWTSTVTRLSAGLFTAFPRVADLFLSGLVRHLPPTPSQADLDARDAADGGGSARASRGEAASLR
jgi:short-subunit dehydrogenase